MQRRRPKIEKRMIASLPRPGLHRWWVLSGVLLATSLLGVTCDPTFSRGAVPAPLLRLVSSATGGAPGDLPSFDPTATADGRFVFFTSYATNFTPSLPARGLRLFRHDMRTGQTTLVPTVGHNPSDPSVSANGRFLAYVSSPDPRRRNAAEEIYVRDLRRGSTHLASRTTGAVGAPAAAPPSHEYHPSVGRPSLSADGRYLAFVSSSPNLYPGVRQGRIPPEIYVRDLRDQTTTLVSRAPGLRGRVADAGCAEPEISADGRYVVFTSAARNLGDTGPQQPFSEGNVFVRDLVGQKTIVASRSARPTHSYSPVISSTGRYVAFFRVGPAGSRQVFERDLAAGRTILVSRESGPAGAPANAFVSSQSFLGISPGGSSVAFFSDATNLGAPLFPGGLAGNAGLYLRDLARNETTFIHWEGFGKPRIVGAGRYLVFGTFNTDQPTPDGAYAAGDVYRFDRGPGT
jgi:hypothetical protein